MSLMEGFVDGLRSALPVVLAYLPVSFALGAAANGLGLSAVEVTVMSAVMFSGANQVFLVSAASSGIPISLAVALCAASSLRHLLYGWVLRDRIPGGRWSRAVFACGLTDEVFATTLSATSGVRPHPTGLWFIWLALVAWATWVTGTLVGSVTGDALRSLSEPIAEAMKFALPALFFGLVWSSSKSHLLLPMGLASAIAAAFILAGLPEAAIPAGALAALAAGRGR